MSLRKAIELIKRNKSFLVTSHINLEGDALGSELSFARLLRRLNKRVLVVNNDALAYGYEFLPGSDKIIRLKDCSMNTADFEVFAALDCSDIKRTGEVYKLNSCGRPVLNIDHHISNSYFGDVNWVDPKASCCCELVYRLFKEMRCPIDRGSALCLYAGILTDTGSFRYANTSALTHKIAAELLGKGIDASGVYKKVYNRVPFTEMKFLIDAMASLNSCFDGRVVWFELNKRSANQARRLSVDLTDYVLSMGRSVKGAQVVVLFRENVVSGSCEVRVNLRAQGKVDVNKIAAKFNGGGHKTASSCTVKTGLSEAKKLVFSEIKKALN